MDLPESCQILIDVSRDALPFLEAIAAGPEGSDELVEHIGVLKAREAAAALKAEAKAKM